MACVSGVAWLQLGGNVKMASSFTCRASWCPFTPLPSPWGSPSPAGQLDCLPGGWLPRAHKQELNAWNWHSIISATSYWLKWVIATIQIPGKSQRGPHKGMDTRSSGYRGQSGRHTTTGKKATETQLGSQLFLPPRPRPFKLPASVPQQWSRGDQRGQSSGPGNDCSLLLAFSYSSAPLGSASSALSPLWWSLKDRNSNWQTVIGIGSNSWLCWKSLCQSKGNSVGLFVINGKFFLLRVAGLSINTTGRGGLSPGPPTWLQEAIGR